MSFALPQASSSAPEVDALIGGLFVITLAVLALVFGLMLVYVVRYRRGNRFDRGALDQKTWRLEIGWTAATLLAFFGLFVWGADLYVRLFQSPADALRIYVVGKQWMWKVEHEGGQAEIDALHVPQNRDIQLIMTSEDVIHDFSVPAFRVKHDVLPGRYESLWFHPTRLGAFPLYCTQFCGTDHAAMIGKVTVLTGPDFADWLDRSRVSAGMVAEGRALFQSHGCSGCHQAAATGSTVRAPSLNGLFGAAVPLADSTVVLADEQYMRDSILYPNRQLVAGYPPLMPSYLAQLDEQDLIRIIAYLKSLPGSPP